jgi:hypothetical protein
MVVIRILVAGIIYDSPFPSKGLTTAFIAGKALVWYTARPLKTASVCLDEPRDETLHLETIVEG